MRQRIVAGNWKMNLGRVDEALAFVRSIRHALNDIDGIDRVLCPPYTVLAPLAEVLRATDIGLGAQNMHWEESGAHTGEIAAGMLADLCQFVIIGHSERRASGGGNETDQAMNRKVVSALTHDLTPIICVGENLTQNESGETQAVVSAQVKAACIDLSVLQVKKCIIAYEPIWAIGTGKSATPTEANTTIGLSIRGTLADLYDEATAQAVRVQYGGSVNPDNITGFMEMPEIDGALVGGASLKPGFVDLVRKAAAA